MTAAPLELAVVVPTLNERQNAVELLAFYAACSIGAARAVRPARAA